MVVGNHVVCEIGEIGKPDMIILHYTAVRVPCLRQNSCCEPDVASAHGDRAGQASDNWCRLISRRGTRENEYRKVRAESLFHWDQTEC